MTKMSEKHNNKHISHSNHGSLLYKKDSWQFKKEKQIMILLQLLLL